MRRVIIEMTRNADVTAAAEIDDGNFDAELLPDRVLERVGHGAGFVRFRRRKWHVSHAAIPRGIVGDERIELEYFDELVAGVLSEPVSAGSEGIQTDAFKELNSSGDA